MPKPTAWDSEENWEDISKRTHHHKNSTHPFDEGMPRGDRVDDSEDKILWYWETWTGFCYWQRPKHMNILKINPLGKNHHNIVK